MIASSIARRLVLAGFGCVTLFSGPRLHAQESDLPESIRTALARYAELDPLAVTWSQATEVTAFGREKIDPSVLNYMNTRRKKILQLAFRDGRMYLRRETMGDSSKPMRIDELAFDRKVLYGGARVEWMVQRVSR